MAQDEGLFGRINEPRKCWAPCRSRPIVGKQIVRQYLYVYAAVCPKFGQMTSLILPYANTDMMNLFLTKVSDDFKNYFVIMQIDQAGWHVSKKLNVPENIRLLPQPAYSPELNPVEHIWEELKEKDLTNTVFESLDELSDKLCEALNRLASKQEYLKSLTNFPHLNVTV